MFNPTPQKIHHTLTRFKKSNKGNVAVMSALVGSLLAVGVGSAIDISNAHSRRTLMQNVADNVALAAVKGNKRADIREFGQASYEYYTIEKAAELGNTSVKIRPRVTEESRAVSVRMSGASETNFLSLMGMKEIPINVISRSERSLQPIEISLVLDVSFSMSGIRIARLRTAATEFIETVIGDGNTSPTASISIIPFGGNVNLGPLVADRLRGRAPNARINPTDAEYVSEFTSMDNLAMQRFRFPGGPSCIETAGEDYDTDRIPRNSRSQVPSFIHPKSGLPFCPDAASSAVFVSNRKARLIDKIQTMTLSHGTSMDTGILWGLKALSPSHRGFIGAEIANRPLNPNRVRKVMVVMTDGNITGAGRTRAPNNPNRNVQGSSNPGSPGVLDAGTDTSTRDLNTSIGRFNHTCDVSRAENIEVFTIGYGISTGTIADQLLQSCATTPDRYLLVSNTDIGMAFADIAASLTQTRISQ